jgi:hypothetical protein
VSAVNIAKVLRVVRGGTGAARLYIDGKLFDYATVGGFTVHPQRGEMPGVTVTIAAWRVELVDDSDARSGDLAPEPPLAGPQAGGENTAAANPSSTQPRRGRQ